MLLLMKNKATQNKKQTNERTNKQSNKQTKKKQNKRKQKQKQKQKKSHPHRFLTSFNLTNFGVGKNVLFL